MAGRRGLLVPVEDTLGSLRSLDWAIKEALRPGDKVWIVHVILTHRPFSSSAEQSPMLGANLEEDHARRWIASRFVPLLESAKIEHEVVIAKAPTSLSVAEVICQQAETLPVHLVVMSSTSGKSGVSYYEGSVLEQCVVNCIVPVLQWRSPDSGFM